MKQVAQAINHFGQEEISTLEREGSIDIEINSEKATLSVDDVIISSQDIEGWLVANSDHITVALDVTITPELKNEGIARELINRIQNIRKESGFEVMDRVDIRLQQDVKLEEAVNQNIEYIKRETLTEVLQFEKEVSNGTDIEFDDIATKLSINKH